MSAGLIFYKGAYISLRHKSFNMDVLVALGTTCAWGYGILLVLFGLTCTNEERKTEIEQINCQMNVMNVVHNFEMSSTLITIILLGKVLEAVSKRKTVEKLE